MPTRIHRRTSISSLVLLCLMGCGRDEVIEQRADAQQAFNTAKAAYAAGRWEEAAKEFDTALAGPLNADLYEDGAICRAVCLYKLKRNDEAKALLAAVEAEATHLDVIYFLRSKILEAEGKRVDAQKELAKAQRMNPRVIRKFKVP